MRLGLILALGLCALPAGAQAGIWDGVSTTYKRPETPAATLTEAQRAAVSRVLREPGEFGGWECSKDEVDAVIKDAQYEWIPVTDRQDVLLVESGAGCARGGQGANGAMWLIWMKGASAALIASPKDGFNGWLYSVQSPGSHGMREVVLGWHMGAREAGLSYFRFDGKRYKPAGSASLVSGEDGLGKIVPNAATK